MATATTDITLRAEIELLRSKRQLLRECQEKMSLLIEQMHARMKGLCCFLNRCEAIPVVMVG